MKNVSEFERKHPDLAKFILIFVVSGAEFWLWLTGAFFVFIIGGVTLSQLSDNTAYILPIMIGFIFLFGILLPIVMVVISWRNNRRRIADSRSRDREDMLD